jgi:hypothetical protein
MKPTSSQQEKLNTLSFALKKYIKDLVNTGYFNNTTFRFESTSRNRPEFFTVTFKSTEDSISYEISDMECFVKMGKLKRIDIVSADSKDLVGTHHSFKLKYYFLRDTLFRLNRYSCPITQTASQGYFTYKFLVDIDDQEFLESLKILQVLENLFSIDTNNEITRNLFREEISYYDTGLKPYYSKVSFLKHDEAETNFHLEKLISLLPFLSSFDPLRVNKVCYNKHNPSNTYGNNFTDLKEYGVLPAKDTSIKSIAELHTIESYSTNFTCSGEQHGSSFCFIAIAFVLVIGNYNLFFTTKEYLQDMEKTFNLQPMNFKGEYLYLGASYCEIGFGRGEGRGFDPREENQDFIHYLQSRFIQRLAYDGASVSLPGLSLSVGNKGRIKGILDHNSKSKISTQENNYRVSSGLTSSD